jgi:hypothetical protein
MSTPALKTKADHSDPHHSDSYFSFEKERSILLRAKSQGMSDAELDQLESRLLKEKYIDFQRNVILPYATLDAIPLVERNKIVERLLAAYMDGAKKSGFSQEFNSIAGAQNTSQQKVPTGPTDNLARGRTTVYRFGDDSNTAKSVLNATATVVSDTIDYVDKKPGYEGVKKYKDLAYRKVAGVFSFAERMMQSDNSDSFLVRAGCSAVGTGAEFAVQRVADAAIGGMSAFAGPAAPFVALGTRLTFNDKIGAVSKSGGDMAQDACRRAFK